MIKFAASTVRGFFTLCVVPVLMDNGAINWKDTMKKTRSIAPDCELFVVQVGA